MRLGRTLPPAAAPIFPRDILHGFLGALRGQAEIERFQAELKQTFQIKHCFLVSSGKAALTLTLKALHSQNPDRDEVLIPAFTCFSVPSAIVRAGLRVRLCDVDPVTLDFDFDHLKQCLKPEQRLLAVISPHLFGLPSDIARVKALTAESSLQLPTDNVQPTPIIEDAAQAMGNCGPKGFLGTQGDIGFFSLGRGKAFSTVEGGILVTDSDKTGQAIETFLQKLPAQSSAQRLKVAAYSFALSALMQPSMFWLPKAVPGLKLGETIFDPNLRVQGFSPYQAGLARMWLKKNALFQSHRVQNTDHWHRLLRRFFWLKPIDRVAASSTPPPLLRYPVMVQSSALRQELLEASERHGLGIMPSYPDSIDGIAGLEIINKGEGFPGAKACAQRLATFPVHGYVTQKDRQRIINCLENLGQGNEKLTGFTG